MLAKCVRVSLQADARAAPHTTAFIAPRQARHAHKANEEHIAHQDRVKQLSRQDRLDMRTKQTKNTLRTKTESSTDTHTVPKSRCVGWVLTRSKPQTDKQLQTQRAQTAASTRAKNTTITNTGLQNRGLRGGWDMGHPSSILQFGGG